jgi:hypothetical protein
MNLDRHPIVAVAQRAIELKSEGYHAPTVKQLFAKVPEDVRPERDQWPAFFYHVRVRLQDKNGLPSYCICDYYYTRVKHGGRVIRESCHIRPPKRGEEAYARLCICANRGRDGRIAGLYLGNGTTDDLVMQMGIEAHELRGGKGVWRNRQKGDLCIKLEYAKPKDLVRILLAVRDELKTLRPNSIGTQMLRKVIEQLGHEESEGDQ